MTRQPRSSRSTSERAPAEKSKRARRPHGQGVEAALCTIVPEPGTFRRGDIESEMLAHSDVAHAAPPAHEQKETPDAGFDRTTQTSLGTTRRYSRGPDISW